MVNQTAFMRNQDFLKERNDKIFQRYSDLYFGQFMRDEQIYDILESEFFLSKRTIYHIVLKIRKTNN